MRFLLDAQLPPALARRLEAEGHDAQHVHQIGLAVASDMEIWTYARQRDATVMSKDEDFTGLSLRDPSGPSVVWIRLGNITNQALWESLEPVLPAILDALAQGERIVEIV